MPPRIGDKMAASLVTTKPEICMKSRHTKWSLAIVFKINTFSRNYQNFLGRPFDPLCLAFLFYHLWPHHQTLVVIMFVHRAYHHWRHSRCNYFHSIVWFVSFADRCSADFCCCWCYCFWFVLWLITSIWSSNNCRSIFSLPFEQLFCRNSRGWSHDDTLNTCLGGLLDSNDVDLAMGAVAAAVVPFLVLNNKERPTTPIKIVVQNTKCLHSNKQLGVPCSTYMFVENNFSMQKNSNKNRWVPSKILTLLKKIEPKIKTI